MNFKIDFTPNKEYYKEAYEEMISTYKLKKWEPIFALLLIVFGLFIYFTIKSENLKFIPFIFIFLGIYELVKFYFEKRKWINDRLKSNVVGKNIEVEFTNDYMVHSGPFSNGKISWDGFKNLMETQKGILLKQENGINIYFSKEIFKNRSEIDFILNKKK